MCMYTVCRFGSCMQQYSLFSVSSVKFDVFSSPSLLSLLPPSPLPPSLPLSFLPSFLPPSFPFPSPSPLPPSLPLSHLPSSLLLSTLFRCFLSLFLHHPPPLSLSLSLSLSSLRLWQYGSVYVHRCRDETAPLLVGIDPQLIGFLLQRMIRAGFVNKVSIAH